jgi:hypothetical protein
MKQSGQSNIDAAVILLPNWLVRSPASESRKCHKGPFEVIHTYDFIGQVIACRRQSRKL